MDLLRGKRVSKARTTLILYSHQVLHEGKINANNQIFAIVYAIVNVEIKIIESGFSPLPYESWELEAAWMKFYVKYAKGTYLVASYAYEELNKIFVKVTQRSMDNIYNNTYEVFNAKLFTTKIRCYIMRTINGVEFGGRLEPWCPMQQSILDKENIQSNK
ncbi:hypothetical protein CR513_54153, partial [Mucuna pruriens]